MLKKVIGIFTALTLIAGIICLPTAAAEITAENFEGVTAVSDIYGSGKLVTTATAGNDKLAIESETNGTYTNKYLSFSGANQQIVTGITLKEGKNVITMRVKFSSGCNELIALRGGGSANTYVLSGMQSTIRLLHDSAKAVTLNTSSWYNLHMIIDTTNKTIDESLSREGSNEWTTHSKTYTEGSNDAKNITAGGAVRIEMQGSDKLCIDDIKVSTVNDSRYIVSESFNQFSAGEQGVAANKAISSHTGLMATAANSVTTETDNGNTYLKLNGGTGLLYGLNLFNGKQIWEMDLKVAPETHAARVFLHKSGGAAANLMYYQKSESTVKAFGKVIGGDLFNKLKTDFVKFTFVIDKGTTETVTVYADGDLVGQLNASDTVYDNIRFELNTGITNFGEGGSAEQSALYIDNINCYMFGNGTFRAAMPTVTEAVDIREEMKITVASNNIINPVSFETMGLDNGGVITAVNRNGGYEYDLVFSGLKPETEYNFTGAAVTDIYGQPLGTVENTSFTTGKVERTETVYVSSSGSDTNEGSETSPFKTIAKACSLYDTAKVIVLNDITENISSIAAYTGEITIEGKERNVKLTVATNTNINGDLTIDNITLYSGGGYPGIYAGGHKLVIGNGVTTETNESMRFSVYGGKLQSETIGDTDITVLGGQYSMICGGGNQGSVTGDTNVIIGGNVNNEDSVKDSDTNYYASYACGGGYKGIVSGTTNITLRDNAKIAYIFGSGNGEGATSSNTNVTINGGNAMNVYGGALDTNITANAKVIMNDGMVEGIFGGSHQADITGSAYIEVNGGEVTRRIYSGSYGGTTGISDGTILVVKPEVKLCTGNGLSLDNQLDMGIHGGSRGVLANETNTVICTGGSGDKLALDNKGWDCIVKATTGGSVEPIGTGVIKIVPDEGNVTYVDNKKLEAETLNISDKKMVVVEFSKIKETLDISIDYENEELTGFVAGGSYKIDGSDIELTDNKYSISSVIADEAKTLSIVKKGDGISTSDSAPQTLVIPARPSVSDDIKIDNSTETITIPAGYKYGTTSANYADIISDGNSEAVTVAPSASVYIYKTAVTEGDNKAFKSAVKTITAPLRKNIDEVKVDFAAETINTDVAMQYSTDNGDTWNNCTAENMSVTAFDGWDGSIEKSVKFRIPSDEDNYSSEVKTVIIPVRPSAPNVTGDAPTENDGDGKIIGTTTAMEYKAVNGNTWEDCSDGETLVSAGRYIVRVKATGSSFVGTETAAVTVPVFSAVKEDTPEITINYTDETLDGFVNGASYTIAVGENAAEAVEPIDGKLVINEKYIGKTIIIVRKASDANYADSTAQTITLDSRAAQPANLTGIKPTTAGGSGKITGTTADMQYKEKDNEQDIWHDCSETETEVVAGKTYLVRTKAVAEGDTKKFASVGSEVEVGEYVEPTPTPDKITVDEEINIVKVPASEISPAKAKASIKMYVPTAKGEQETIFILAVYKDNVLQSIKYINEKVIGDKLFEAETDIVENGVTVKAMLWDSKMKPFVNAKSLEF